jgi:hypothetical protein
MLIYQQYFMRIFQHKIECFSSHLRQTKTEMLNSLGGHIVVLRSAEKIIWKEAAYFYINTYYHTHFRNPDISAVSVSRILYVRTFAMLITLN